MAVDPSPDFAQFALHFLMEFEGIEACVKGSTPRASTIFAE